MALTEKEAQIYDRQIRLWGVEAQQRMRSSKVLVAGFGSLGAEVAKNVTLAGVNMTIIDDVRATEADLNGNFFLNPADVGSNRASASLPRLKELNPHITVDALETDVGSLSDEALKGFTCIVLCNVNLLTQIRVAGRCHGLKVPIIAGSTLGFHAFFWEDAGEHTYVIEYRTNTATGEVPRAPERFTVQYKSLSEAMATPWSSVAVKATRPAAFAYMALLHAALAGAVSDISSPTEVAAAINAHSRRLCEGSGAALEGRMDNGIIEAMAAGFGHDLSVVSTIVGGVIGNEVVKLLTGKEEPVRNLFAMDTMGGGGGNINTF